MASGAPSPGGWLRTPTSVPLIPVSSEYDRLLVQEPLNELGGGPMDPEADERLLVLNDASRIAAEGLAERIAARAASPRGVVLGSIACFALMCFAAFRKAESHDASLVARLSEGMFLGGHRGGDSDSRPTEGRLRAAALEGHEFPLEHRLAPRAAAMPRDDDGAAQRAVDDAAAGASERSALRAALRGAATAPMDASALWCSDFPLGRYSSQGPSSAASSSPSSCSSRIASSALRVAEHRNFLPIFSSARIESRIRRFAA